MVVAVKRMPSACTKPDKKASVEAETPLKQAINLIEKKVRNLEKRKVCSLANWTNLRKDP